MWGGVRMATPGLVNALCHFWPLRTLALCRHREKGQKSVVGVRFLGECFALTHASSSPWFYFHPLPHPDAGAPLISCDLKHKLQPSLKAEPRARGAWDLGVSYTQESPSEREKLEPAAPGFQN